MIQLSKNVGKDKSLVNDILINILPTSINDLQADYISVYESCEHIEGSKTNTLQSLLKLTPINITQSPTDDMKKISISKTVTPLNLETTSEQHQKEITIQKQVDAENDEYRAKVIARNEQKEEEDKIEKQYVEYKEEQLEKKKKKKTDG